ncbi:DUF6193 family natural product biosynthesis protein [Streptomyces sp. NPDC047024]|uniref:DUF6193 family natural product biosynthesis protein n=1 Tax=Streptomyces sp. NPDC047024 TaxID=3155476 RepID=UPI00340FBDF4
MTRSGPSAQPFQPNSDLYPDVATAGSLAAALAQCASENGWELGEARSAQDRSSLICATVTSRNPRLDGFGVHLGSRERVFIVAAWGQGVNLTNGSTDDLTELARAAAAWHEGVPLAALAAAVPFLEVSALAAAHERGPEFAVAEKWRRYLQPGPYQNVDVIRAAYAQPRLRALFPFTSHGSLLFSRCTGWPFSRDMSAIHRLGDGRYAVQHRDEEFTKTPAYTAEEAAALVVARMSPTWGPAISGTADDLQDRESS